MSADHDSPRPEHPHKSPPGREQAQSPEHSRWRPLPDSMAPRPPDVVRTPSPASAPGHLPGALVGQGGPGSLAPRRRIPLSRPRTGHSEVVAPRPQGPPSHRVGAATLNPSSERSASGSAQEPCPIVLCLQTRLTSSGWISPSRSCGRCTPVPCLPPALPPRPPRA